MGEEKTTTDEDIGRPGPWKEGRYQGADQPLDASVRPPSGSQPSPEEPRSTPVTWKEYLTASEQANRDEDAEPPGGDAG